MAFLGGMSGAAGIGGANIVNPVSSKQIKQSYENTQTGLKQQQDFINAIQAQNGIGNQGAVFQQQQDLANQLQQGALGQGPSPALAQLNQQTGANVANQAALMAGQRGASQNSGLIARQVGQQGGALQQQAVGQGATLHAQQQLAAQQALMQQQSQMGNLASNQVGAQQAGVSGYQQGALNQQQNLLNAAGGFNTAQVQNQQLQNSARGGLLNSLGALAPMIGMAVGGPAGAMAGSAVGGAISGGPSVAGGAASNMGTMTAAHGGMVPHYDQGGQVYGWEQKLHSLGDSFKKAVNAPGVTQEKIENQSFLRTRSNSDSSVGSAPSSNAGKHLKGYACGGMINGEMYAAQGKVVPGQARVSGDNLKNDTVDAKLSPGEIIIPRSIAQSPDAPEKAKAFVAAIMARSMVKK